MSIAGKTIDRVEELTRDSYGTYRMWFTDGTCVDLEPTGYEADDIRFTERTPEDLERLRVEAEQAEYRRKVEAARRARLREEKRAEMQACLSPRQYEKWLAERDSLAPFARAMQMEYNDALRDQMAAMNKMGFGL